MSPQSTYLNMAVACSPTLHLKPQYTKMNTLLSIPEDVLKNHIFPKIGIKDISKFHCACSALNSLIKSYIDNTQSIINHLHCHEKRVLASDASNVLENHLLDCVNNDASPDPKRIHTCIQLGGSPPGELLKHICKSNNIQTNNLMPNIVHGILSSMCSLGLQHSGTLIFKSLILGCLHQNSLIVKEILKHQDITSHIQTACIENKRYKKKLIESAVTAGDVQLLTHIVSLVGPLEDEDDKGDLMYAAMLNSDEFTVEPMFEFLLGQFTHAKQCIVNSKAIINDQARAKKGPSKQDIVRSFTRNIKDGLLDHEGGPGLKACISLVNTKYHMNLTGSKNAFLLEAIDQSNLPLVKVLLDMGANPNLKQGAAIVAACSGDELSFNHHEDQLPVQRHADLDIARLLLEKGVDVNAQAMTNACKHKSIDLVDLLLSHNFPVTRQAFLAATMCFKDFESVRCPGYRKIRMFNNRALKLTETLIKNGHCININYGDPLAHALDVGAYDMCSLLIGYGANYHKAVDGQFIDIIVSDSRRFSRQECPGPLTVMSAMLARGFQYSRSKYRIDFQCLLEAAGCRTVDQYKHLYFGPGAKLPKSEWAPVILYIRQENNDSQDFPLMPDVWARHRNADDWARVYRHKWRLNKRGSDGSMSSCWAPQSDISDDVSDFSCSDDDDLQKFEPHKSFQSSVQTQQNNMFASRIDSWMSVLDPPMNSYAFIEE